MLFLEDFLEMLEELPGELRERCSQIRDMDVQISAAYEKHELLIREFFEKAAGMSPTERAARMQQMQQEYAVVRGKSDQKVALAERMQELLEKYTQHLEKEKTHFKYELEADNPGVTAAIEKRFSDYVETMMNMRRDRRKRNHSSQAKSDDSAPSTPRQNGSSSGGHRSGPPPPKAIKMEGASSSADLFDSSPTLSALIRSRKNSQNVGGDDAQKQAARRDAIRAQLQSSLSVVTSALSPAPSPSSTGGTSEVRWELGPESPASSNPHSPAIPTLNHPFIPSSCAPSPISSLSTPSSVISTLSPAASSTMPSFTGSESRHGRHRKLTTRVQEMFHSAMVSQRERSARHSNAALHAPPVMTPTVPPVEAPHHHTEGPPGSSMLDEDGADERLWCFCSEKSYGNMVACDNKQCPYEWFHMPCVGLEVPPKGKWFCPHCAHERSVRAGSTASNRSNQ